MYISFYNRSCDVIQDTTDSIIDAQHIAGELIDNGFKDDIKVFIYDTDTDDQPQKELTLEEFVKSPFNSIFGNRPVNTEIYHNLDQEEQIEVLHFIPDHIIIAEIERRMDQYRETLDNITVALDRMEIFR